MTDLMKDHGFITGSQIRAARALLTWTAYGLAERAGVSYATVQRAEQAEGMPNMLSRNLAAVKAALEAGGIEFIDGPYQGDGGPGVRR